MTDAAKESFTPTVSSFDTGQFWFATSREAFQHLAAVQAGSNFSLSLNHNMPDRQQKLTAFAMTITTSC